VLRTSELTNTVFAGNLQPVSVGGVPVPGLMEWKATEIVPLVTPGKVSLKFATAITTRAGFEMLEALMDKLSKAFPSVPEELSALIGALGNFSQGLDAQGRRALLQSAVEVFKPRLTAFLDRRVAPLQWCQAEEHGNTVSCTVRVLADAAYEPLLNSVIDPGSQGDSARLARQLYLKLDELDPLGTTPLLFNIGPGATLLTRFGHDDPTLHFTLLDKFGFAHRFGQRKAWELGGFVGGFVDAIIRTAAEGKDGDPYWLAGGTFGYRRFSPRYPFGFELHVAAAMPFETSNFSDKVAAAFGLNLIVPAELAFTE